jgi:lauroyl/myristoyl acyltransferase
MRIPFRRVKDVFALPVHWVLMALGPLPEAVQYGLLSGLALPVAAYYFSPGSHARRTLANFCRLTATSDPYAIYSHMVRNAIHAAVAFGQLMKRGPAAIVERCAFAPELQTQCDAIVAANGAAIVVMPHCVGSMLSAAAFARRYPTVVLVREPRSQFRSRLVRQYFDKLETEIVFVRRMGPSTVARAILRALHDHKFVVGTTDTARRTADTIEVRMFGQRVPLAAWPARFAARRHFPIVPCYARMDGRRIVLTAGEAYLEEDPTVSTQRWASHFEQSIRESPRDWLLMFDKHWARIFAAAAAARTG